MLIVTELKVKVKVFAKENDKLSDSTFRHQPEYKQNEAVKRDFQQHVSRLLRVV
jgi:hypothetical protein